MNTNNNKPEFVHMKNQIQISSTSNEIRIERLRIEVRNQIKYLRRHIKTMKRVMKTGNMEKISEAAYRYNGTMYNLRNYLKELKMCPNPTKQIMDVIEIAEEMINKAWYEINN